MITPDKFVSQHDELFKKFTGAFCLEHLLWRYAHEALLTKKEINGIFHLLVQSLCGIVTASILRIEAPRTILDIKRSAIQCARALGDEVHAYNPASLLDTFRRLGAHFRHSMLAETTKYALWISVEQRVIADGTSRTDGSRLVALGSWLVRVQTAPRVHDDRHVRVHSRVQGRAARGAAERLSVGDAVDMARLTNRRVLLLRVGPRSSHCVESAATKTRCSRTSTSQPTWSCFRLLTYVPAVVSMSANVSDQET